MQVAILSLSSCLGCQMVFLSLEEYFYSFIGDYRIAYAPLLMDHREMPSVDLALVEGTVRDARHFLKAREVREKAGRVVALGTCACFGGVQGLADRFSEESLLKGRFGHEPVEGAPQGVRRLLPLDSYIRVDAYLPGCPPSTQLLRGFLQVLLSGSTPTREGSTVCAECAVVSPQLPQPGPRRITDTDPPAGTCLLDAGFLCMGPLTRDGCGALCPTSVGVPCRGCRGPSSRVLTDSTLDVEKETARRLSRATGVGAEDVRSAIKDPVHAHYLFTLAEPLLRRRRGGGTAPYLYRLGERGAG